MQVRNEVDYIRNWSSFSDSASVDINFFTDEGRFRFVWFVVQPPLQPDRLKHNPPCLTNPIGRQHQVDEGDGQNDEKPRDVVFRRNIWFSLMVAQESFLEVDEVKVEHERVYHELAAFRVELFCIRYDNNEGDTQNPDDGLLYYPMQPQEPVELEGGRRSAIFSERYVVTSFEPHEPSVQMRNCESLLPVDPKVWLLQNLVV